MANVAHVGGGRQVYGSSTQGGHQRTGELVASAGTDNLAEQLSGRRLGWPLAVETHAPPPTQSGMRGGIEVQPQARKAVRPRGQEV